MVRLPFVAQPLSSDESGFMVVASQRDPGTSLDGNYWVDRPPLLLDFFSLADHLGGTIALRLLGVGLVALSVVLAGRIGTFAVPRGQASLWTPVLTAGTAAVFLVNPLFGAMEVNGELIAVALVLISTERLLHALTATTPRSATWSLVTAGTAAAAAVLVKQNEIDAMILTAVLAIGAARHPGIRFAGRHVAAVAVGASACVGMVLAHAVGALTPAGGSAGTA